MGSATPIGNELVERLCKPGQGKATCAFLGCQSQWMCLKGSDLEQAIRARQAKMVAKNDNCSGPPDFTPTGV